MSFSSSSNSQYLKKKSWIGPWVIRIDWCEGHWCGSTFMVMRLSDISSKMAKKNAFFACFWAYVRQPNEKNLAVHMRYHLFLYYGWFLQNLGKNFIPSIMHTTVRDPWCAVGRDLADRSRDKTAILTFFWFWIFF